jgi:rubredoxin
VVLNIYILPAVVTLLIKKCMRRFSTMKQYVRCKACGYIMDTGRPYDLCPACGVPKTAFEPYKLNLSERRKVLLDLHIHPIILHFPQSFVVFGLFLMLAIPFLTDPLKDMFISTAKVIITLLPLSVAAGFLSGLLDGKLRYKKDTTPILKIKIVIGSIFVLTSFACAAVILFMDFTKAAVALELILLFVGSFCSVVLGKLGGPLIETRLPG